MNAEAEAFLEAVRALDLLQDQLDWADVKPSWKSAAARWAKQLRKCRYPADLDLLWKLAGELMKDIKPTNFIVGWLVNADGSESTRYRQWLTETDASSAFAILKAVRVLRAHLVRVLGGPLYALDGTPLADAAHASAAPAPLATEPVEPPREVSAAGLAAAASAAAKLVRKQSKPIEYKCADHPDCILGYKHRGPCQIVDHTSAAASNRAGRSTSLLPGSFVDDVELSRVERLPSGQAGKPKAAATATSAGADYAPPPKAADALPPGWTEQRHYSVSRPGGYATFHGPNGEKARSIVEAFRIHSEQAPSASAMVAASKPIPHGPSRSSGTRQWYDPEERSGKRCSCESCVRVADCGECKACLKVREMGRKSKEPVPRKDEHVCYERVCQLQYSKYANMLVRCHEYEKALPAFDAALTERQLAPKRALVLRNRAYCLMKLGRYGEALADAQLAIELEPEGASNWFRQMDALMELAKVAQQEKNAAEEYRRWLQARETVERWRAYVAQQSTAAVDKMKASSDSHFKKMQEYEYATHFSRLYELEADGAAGESVRTEAEAEAASAAAAEAEAEAMAGAVAMVEDHVMEAEVLEAVAVADATEEEEGVAAEGLDVLEAPNAAAQPMMPLEARSAEPMAEKALPAAPEPMAEEPLVQDPPAVEEPREVAAEPAPSAPSAAPMDVDDEEAGAPNGAAAAAVSEAAKPVVHAVNSVDLTEEGAAAPLSAAQAEQVVAAMDAMRRARTTATAVVHGWHLTLTVRPRGGQCDMRAVSSRGDSARIDSMVKLRKHLGLASAGLSSDGGDSDAAPAALPVTLARAPATLAPALAASSGQPAASPFIAPKLDMASLAEGAFGGLQPPPTTISPVPAATHNLPAGDARIGSIFETREGARVAIGKRVRVYWDLYDSWFSGVVREIGTTHKAKVVYDDGDVRWQKLWLEKWEFVDHERTEAAEREARKAALERAAHAKRLSKTEAEAAAAAAAAAAAEDSEDDEPLAAAAARLGGSRTPLAGGSSGAGTPFAKSETTPPPPPLLQPSAVAAREGVAKAAAVAPSAVKAQPAAASRPKESGALIKKPAAAGSGRGGGGAPKPTAPATATEAPAEDAPAGYEDVSNALLNFEDSVPMARVTNLFGQNLRAWQKEVRRAGAEGAGQLAVLAKKLRELRTGLLETNLSGTLQYLSPDWRMTGGGRHRAWVKATKEATSAAQLLELVHELQRAYGQAQEQQATPTASERAPPVRAASAKATGKTKQVLSEESDDEEDVAEEGEGVASRQDDDDDEGEPSDDSEEDMVITKKGKYEPVRSRLVKGSLCPLCDGRHTRGPCPPWDRLEYANAQVGRRVRLYWGGNHMWYKGKIKRVNPKTHTVLIQYSDGDEKWHSLWDPAERWEFLDSAPTLSQSGKLSQRSTSQPPALLPGQRKEAELKKHSPQPLNEPRVKSTKLLEPGLAKHIAKSSVLGGKASAAAASTEGVAPSAGVKRKAALEAVDLDDDDEDRPLRAHKKAAKPKPKPKGSPGAKQSSAPAPPTLSKAAVAVKKIKEDTKTVGEETPPPVFLAPNQQPCSCVEEPMQPCADACCKRYRYFCGLRHFADSKGFSLDTVQKEQELKKLRDGGMLSPADFEAQMHMVEAEKEARKAMLEFTVGDGVCCNDSAGLESLPLIALFAGARQRKLDRHGNPPLHFIEVLCRWFIRANDIQAPPWLSTPLGKGYGERYPTAPVPLLYRVGGGDPSEWLYNWVDVSSVIGKCRCLQVPTRTIMHECDQTIRRENARGVAWTFYYDSSASPSIDETSDIFEQPVQLSGSKTADAGEGALPSASAEDVRHQLYGSDDEEAEEDVPLTSRENAAARHRQRRAAQEREAAMAARQEARQSAAPAKRYRIKRKVRMPGEGGGDDDFLAAMLENVSRLGGGGGGGGMRAGGMGAGGMGGVDFSTSAFLEEVADATGDVSLCGVCGEGSGTLIDCGGVCRRAFHPDCAGIGGSFQNREMLTQLKRESKWECSHCRMGKATCVVCHQDGFVNSEESGLVRCAVDGCGRAYHRACLDGDGADGAVAGWSCPVHACFMCSATDVRRPMLVCWACPKAFCDRASCRPSSQRMAWLGGRHILCDKTQRQHQLARALQGVRPSDITSVLDEARGGAAFEDLMLPERGDHEAGLGVVASVARAPPPAQMLGVALALHAAAATAAADSPMTRLHELPSQRYAAYLDASEKHTLALGAKSLRECHAAGRVPSLGTVTVPRHLQGGDALAARLGSVVLQGGRLKQRVPAGGLPQASVRQELEEVPYNAGALASAGAGVWAVASPSRFRVEVGEPSVEPFGGRFYPLLVSRLLPNLVDGQMVEALPSSVQRPLLSCKLDAIMREASGPGSAAHSLITRGVAIEPSLATAPGDQLFGGGGDVYISSVTNPSTSDMVSSRDLAEVLELLARQGLTPQLRSRLAGFKSKLRSALNGVMLNRAKYTSFSRHYTAYRVLKKIAERLNPLLRPGDTFVDFACGQNSFGGLLRDPLTQQTLPTVSFDVLSPAENASNFHRRNWFAVSAAEMPPGELVVGLNPPFGHLNKTAIDFVKHALCMRPRLLVLVMPATNYQPEGYELVHHDDQLCRGFAFYVPGSVSANRIHAKNVAPAVYIYRRKPDAPGPCERQCHCVHREDLRRRMVLMKRKRDVKEQQSRIASELERQRLAGLEPRAPKSSRSALSVGMVERGGPGLAGTFVSQPAWQQHV